MSSRTIRGAILERTGAERPYAGSRPLRVAELELDPPGPGEVLVRIEAAGVCHSDLSVVNGSRIRPLPMLLGHEAAGRIEELGPDVPDLRPGQRVVMAFLPRCGECAACRTNGKMPCTPGSAANNEGTLLGGGIRLTAAAEPCCTIWGFPLSRPTPSSITAPSLPWTMMCRLPLPPCSGVQCLPVPGPC